MELECFGSEELPKLRDRGFGVSGAIHVDPPAPGGLAFLLDAGGQDYVGKNSYDDTSLIDE